MEEVDEHTFLFGGKHSANAHHLAPRATRVYEDLPSALHRLERSSRQLGVGCFFNDLLPDGHKLLGGDDCRCTLIALNLALISALEGGADGDDPTWAQHLELYVGVVRDGYELRVAWSS